MLLSFIVPFFNSEKKSKRLLTTLSNIGQDDIEIILIDDGSTDDTYKTLSDFKINASNKNVEVIKQENKGPGGARNAGLRVAKGKYVWFVDSDDDVNLEAIDIIRNNCESNYDFIDFNVKMTQQLVNSMNLMAGEYSITEENRVKFIEDFGRISSKAIRRKLIIENEFFYPEYCLYEDNPLGYIYPFFIKKFLKTDFVGYLHHLEFESITRSKINLRTFDRLQTAIYGIERGLKLTNNDAEIKVLERMFINTYLIVTTGMLLTKKPSKNWIITWRVMKHYRDIAKKLDIKSSPFEAFKQTTCNKKVRSYFAFQWAASFLITKDQTEYFDTIHKKAWN